MSNKLVILLIIVVAVIGGAIFSIMTSANSQEQALDQTPNNAAGTIEEGSGQLIEAYDNPIGNDSNSRYVNFSQNLPNSDGKQRVLYFYANWCPTCKVANDEFSEKPGDIPEDVVVIRTNYNDDDTDQAERNLAQKYNITYQHTFVLIDDNGGEITKWNGGGIDEVVKNVN